MPDIHWGYGFCIGGVAATDPEEGGVISPGGVGYDINCGVRLLRIEPRAGATSRIGSGRWSTSSFAIFPPASARAARISSTRPKLTRLMAEGASYVVNLGYGSDHDLLVTEAGGRLDGADPGRVSDRAITRGYDQCGTLGSGNHFLEVQVVDRVLDPVAAEVMGLREGQITVLDPFGLARSGLSGLRRLPGDVQERTQAIWLRASRLAARLCAGAQPGGASVPGGDARPRPITPGAIASSWPTRHARSLPSSSARPGSSSAWSWSTTSRTTSPSSRITTSAAAARSRSAFTARGRPGPFRRVIPRSRRFTAQSASPSSFPAAWGRRAGCWPGQAGSMEHSFGTSCHGAGRMMSRTAAVKLAAGPAHRPGARQDRHHRPRPRPQRPGRGTAGCLQGRRSRGRRRRQGRNLEEGGAAATDRRDQGLITTTSAPCSRATSSSRRCR